MLESGVPTTEAPPCHVVGGWSEVIRRSGATSPDAALKPRCLKEPRCDGRFPPSGRPASPWAAPADQATPGARARVLTTADRLFYDEGVRVVGRRPPHRRGARDEGHVLQALRREGHPRARLPRACGTSAPSPGVTPSSPDVAGGRPRPRGVVDRWSRASSRLASAARPWSNAAAEFSDPTHPVRAAVAEHREWLTDALVELFKDAGHPMPGDAADDFLLALDGAESGAYCGDAIAASAASAAADASAGLSAVASGPRQRRASATARRRRGRARAPACASA